MSIFHRYKSTIHGNYRRAYLRSGLLTGALLAAYVTIRLLAGSPMERPVSLISDILLLVLLFLLTAWYRNSLPEKRITLKEAMLFGIGTSAVAALVYGLALWAVGLLSDSQTVLFTTSMTGNPVTTDDPQLHYWAAWWALFAAASTLLLGAFASFLAAIFFRNEKSEIKHKLK